MIGILVLVIAWYLPDRFFFEERHGLQKFLPYLLLLTMYGWIVFHNRILLDTLYFSEKRQKYFLWTGTVMIVGSLNIYLTIRLLFGDFDPLPQILGFWVFTIAGTGVYLLFRYRGKIMEPPVIIKSSNPGKRLKTLDFASDGRQHSLPLDSILYLESLENYIRIITHDKQFLARMSMKEAEQRLSLDFIRISRSHLVNLMRIDRRTEDIVVVGNNELRIGKVYKKYVTERLAQ